jgi:hypothetical protein
MRSAREESQAYRRGHRLGHDWELCRCGTYLRIRQAIHRAAVIAAGKQPTQSAQNAAGKE